MMLWNKPPKMAGLMAAPVQSAGVQQRLAHGAVEIGHRQRLLKQLAVDVGEGGHLLVQHLAALGGVGVEGLEELRQAAAQVRAVHGGALFNLGAKSGCGLEDAGIVRKQAKQQAHQQHFQRVAGVAAGLERVVQLAHALGGFDVDGVLRLDDLRFVAGDEAEELDVFVQVGEVELEVLARCQPMHPESRKIADDDDLRQIALGNAGEVAQSLRHRRVQVFTARLLLHQQHAGPKQIDEAVYFGFVT